MLGAIIGDVIGSRFERNNVKSKDFELFTPKSRFTDDTVLTVAVADSILNGMPCEKIFEAMGENIRWQVMAATFKKWLGGIIQGPYK